MKKGGELVPYQEHKMEQKTDWLGAVESCYDEPEPVVHPQQSEVSM
jgi:hypothetical protein